ncbi:MAG: asparagine synthase (glutamine-hydrolyzing) [Acidobacteria bacterium 13_2_20CM_2_66_4]|nr:MAG: asparagine synthase (glutamine-hydrolyzing) [Acidobacteria bacterium 13_2_20CM_2_66_4]
MCGITGKFSYGGAPIDPELLTAMTDAVTHRGPDAAGYYLGDGIGLGHRRLSIIDLSTGDQPLTNEDRTVWVVFNGEIYNFHEVRRELEAAGHRFCTRSDTEVIVHGYEEWGDECVSRFGGMFAFALWDVRRRRLMLARDRLGVKPLYFARLPNGLVFGSEIKSLLQDESVPREWRADALDAYLTLEYIPGPATIYEHVEKLPPGHVLIAEGGEVRLRQYWDLRFTGDGDAGREDEYLERLDALLRDSVRMRLISDVPIGAFLSGGIDSSTVVAYMVETSDAPVVTTSVGFAERAFDELEHARVVAEHLGCEHHPVVANPDVRDLLPKLAWHFDEPFADPSAVPTYYVSAAARERVTVALSGDGGDELWAGYARHRVEQWEARVRGWLGPWVSRIAGHVGRQLPRGIKGARAIGHLALSPDDACAHKHAYDIFEADRKAALYTADFKRALRGADPFATFRAAWNACGSPDPLDRALYVDVKTYMLDDILTKVDRMSMAVSLETREPLLDHRLLEFAATVPTSLKLRGNRGKYLLRRVLERRVPRAILERPKQGFEPPTGEWLCGPLAEMTGDLLLDGRLHRRGLFRRDQIERMWGEHRTGRRDHRERLWTLVMLELWFREFIDGARTRNRTTSPPLTGRRSESATAPRRAEVA